MRYQNLDDSILLQENLNNSISNLVGVWSEGGDLLENPAKGTQFQRDEN